MFKETVIIRKISAIIDEDKTKEAKNYIKKSIDDYCRNNPRSPFSVCTLFGGENRDWRETPLQAIYEKQPSSCKDAKKQAAIDVGWLLKEVLARDKEHTYKEFNGYTKSYIRID